MIESLGGFPQYAVGILCKERITRKDYETVLVPAVEAALKSHDKVRLYYQIDRDFAGIDTGAMWEDFKIGMAHLARWERVAVVTDIDWIRNTMLAFSFILPGQVKVFSLAQSDTARKWIAEPQ